jgi:ABC-type branched-subunit amino acid transport system ATPase component
MGRLVTPIDGKGAPPTIDAKGIVVAYGGVRAVDQVSLHADSGEIVGIVGPNGAGKTTLFDVLSGHLRPKSGRVLLGGRDITGLRAERRARLGLGRTYQQARLFDDMPLLDAVKLALERGDMSNRASLRLVVPSFGSERRKDLRAEELLEIIGLAPFSHSHPNEISTGMRRIAEIACTVGMGARVLLLDEPTAGIARDAAAEFLPILREIRQHLGATMVVIEHDMPLVMGLVDRLYVLNYGAVIAEGPPRLLREDPQVVAAYIGTDEPVVASADTL